MSYGGAADPRCREGDLERPPSMRVLVVLCRPVSHLDLDSRLESHVLILIERSRGRPGIEAVVLVLSPYPILRSRLEVPS